MDEGYSGEETPSLYEDPNQREDMRSARDSGELKIPAWMTGLNDALREGLFVFCDWRTQGFLFCISGPSSSKRVHDSILGTCNMVYRV